MSHRRSCHRAATRRALRDTLLPLRTLSSSVHALRADAGSSRSSFRPGSDRVRVRDCRTRASTGYRRALPRRPDQTDCTTAAGSRCATSRRWETLDDRLEDPPSDNAARSLLPALTTAPPRPSRLETRRAWCASSCPHSPTSRSSVARPYCRPQIKAAVCHDPEVDQRFPNSNAEIERDGGGTKQDHRPVLVQGRSIRTRETPATKNDVGLEKSALQLFHQTLIEFKQF